MAIVIDLDLVKKVPAAPTTSGGRARVIFSRLEGVVYPPSASRLAYSSI